MKRLHVLIAILLLLSLLWGCTAPIEETYAYTAKSKHYVQPAVVDGWAERDALTTTTEDGTFYCFTADTAQADDFINAQRTLLRFLRNCGVEIGEMEHYGTDYGYSFSESSDASAYVALSDVCTWQQVLVTLQAIWGDYTDYGYVYAMANAVADELNWETDEKSSVEKEALDTFFTENPDAIHLLYPTFTEALATEETVQSCKALSRLLFDGIKWRKALAKPIAEQLDDYSALLSGYAQDIGIPFTRQSCGYAYYGEKVKLRIRTAYAELIVDRNFSDEMASLYGEPFGDYQSVYQTADRVNSETSAAVERLGAEEKAGMMTIKFVDGTDEATEKYTGLTGGQYYFSTKIAYVSSIYPYLHEYHHHLEQLFNIHNGQSWQSQAFCEIGASHSYYYQARMETMQQGEKLSELFYALTGRAYQPRQEDFYEVYDILCFINDNFDLSYYDGGPLNSISHYLIDRYGEDTTSQLMLFPNTVEEVTGKSWDEWRQEWKAYILDKYADRTLPDWLALQ